MDIKIERKHYTLIALVIVFLLFGAIIGYVVNTPASVEEPVATPTATPIVDEPVATITATPDAVATTVAPTPTEVEPTETPLLEPDFTATIYNPETDKSTKTIEFTSRGAEPNTLSIRPGNSVLFTITDYTVQSPITFILNSSYEKNLGKSGAVVVTFNNKGTYDFKAIIPSGDPNILPKTYSEGTITVYTIS